MNCASARGPPWSSATTGTPSASASTQTRWRTIVNDQFNKRGLPHHWLRYSHPYGSAPNNCTDPAHDYVSGGYLHIVEKYEASKPVGVECPYGAGWYTGGVSLPEVAPYSVNNQRITVRFRIVSVGGPSRSPLPGSMRRAHHAPTYPLPCARSSAL